MGSTRQRCCACHGWAGGVAFLPENFLEMFPDNRAKGEDIFGDISTKNNIKSDPKVVMLQQYSLKLQDQVLNLQRYSGKQTKSVTHGENLVCKVNSTNGNAIGASLVPKLKALATKTTDPEILKQLNNMVASITGMKEDFPARWRLPSGGRWGRSSP